jgi:methyl-accepting chemotaxis protein
MNPMIARLPIQFEIVISTSASRLVLYFCYFTYILRRFVLKFNIKGKILTIILISSLVMLMVGSIGYYYTNMLSNEMKTMYNENLLSIKRLNETRHNFRAVHGMILEMIFGNLDKSREDNLTAQMKALSSETDKTLKAYESQNLSSFEREKLVTLKEAIGQYRSERQKAIELSQQGRKQDAYVYFTQQAASKLEVVNSTLKELADYMSESSEKANSKGEEHAKIAGIVIFTLTGFFVLLCTFLGWRLSNQIASRLQKVVAFLNEIANGNIGVENVKIRAQDEIGDIGVGLNKMADSLKILVRQVADSAEQVAASSEELTASAEQSAQATNQVAATISEVAQGAQQQADGVAITTSVVEQLSTGIEQVATNAAIMGGVSDKTFQAAQDGTKAVTAAIHQMEIVEKTVNKSAQVVAKLGERSKEIGQIVDTISGIAGQTNLLALNAAIEAARAGEHGRGFAVVAEEVRKLAEQSQEAAKQIANIITETQTDTEQAVVAMSEGSREVNTGAEVVNTAGQAFKEISAFIEQLANQIKESSASIQQMASGSQQIVESVRDIDKISKEAVGSTQTVSAATEEQSASMEEIAASSQALAKMAEELQGVVRKFKM